MDDRALALGILGTQHTAQRVSSDSMCAPTLPAPLERVDLEAIGSRKDLLVGECAPRRRAGLQESTLSIRLLGGNT